MADRPAIQILHGAEIVAQTITVAAHGTPTIRATNTGASILASYAGTWVKFFIIFTSWDEQRKA